MIDAASKTDAPFREILVWKFSRFTRKRENAVAFKSMLRRKGVRVVSITEQADDTPPASCLRESSRAWTSSTSENLRGRSRGDAGGRLSRLLDRPAGHNRVMCKTGLRRGPRWNPTRTRPASSSASSTWPRPVRGCCASPIPSTDEGIPSPAGKLWSKNGIHFILRNEVYTGALVWGTAGKG